VTARRAWTSQDQRDFMGLHKQFENVLSDAQKERSKRPDTVMLGGRREYAWVIFEREALFNAVNRERSARGLPGVTLQKIMLAESMASGHSDYTTKFALYCPEFVKDLNPNV
jgi:hypothetical protein